MSAAKRKELRHTPLLFDRTKVQRLEGTISHVDMEVQSGFYYIICNGLCSLVIRPTKEVV